jgi:hypothetical protein
VTLNERLKPVRKWVALKVMVKAMEQREKHKETKRADAFPHTPRYHISKIFESTSSPDRFPPGDANVKMIEGFLEKFKQQLTDREEWCL